MRRGWWGGFICGGSKGIGVLKLDVACWRIQFTSKSRVVIDYGRER